MKLTLIICTYKRPQAIMTLLDSVLVQTVYPDEILIIDGSPEDDTRKALESEKYPNLVYCKVTEENRGLTKQRNFGVAKVSDNTDVICFLDDDTILDSYYFEEILKVYKECPSAIGVGGYITNEVSWLKVDEESVVGIEDFVYDGWKRKEPSRFVWRKKVGLDVNVPPGFLPEFSHGRSISFLPPTHRIYQVEQLMGGVSSFKKELFQKIQFSSYFEGYGLYEDADFTLRASKYGKLYVSTKAKLEHHHDAAGRPNKYKYGKMVVRNGWYVWRVKYPKPSFNAKLKWHTITLLLTAIRALNVITTNKRKEAFTESFGRVAGWVSLIFKKPKIHI